MQKINLFSSNKDRAIVLTLIIVAFIMISIVFPFIFINYIPQSIVGSYLTINSDFLLITIPIIFYFIYTGVFIYQVKIDPYVINISSFRSISSFFYEKDSIDISHLMLQEYAFFDRAFTLNRTLMIKIKTDSNKIVAKRFTLSLLGNKEQKRISKTLDQILLNNSKWKKNKIT